MKNRITDIMRSLKKPKDGRVEKLEEEVRKNIEAHKGLRNTEHAKILGAVFKKYFISKKQSHEF